MNAVVEHVEIGIFWELEQYSAKRYADPFNFGKILLELSRSFCSSPSLSCAQVFVDTCGQEDDNSLRSLGFQVISLDRVRPRGPNFLTSSILLWLLDCERTKQFSVNHIILIVTSNPAILPTLGLLKTRKVQVIVVTDFSITDRGLWEAVTDIVININDLCLHFETTLTNDPRVQTNHLSVSLPAQESCCTALCSRLETLDHWLSTSPSNPLFNSSHHQMNTRTDCIPIDYQLPPVAKVQDVLIHDNIFTLQDEKTTDEQRVLQDDLVRAFRTKNVQVSVSTLRKIYTKQNKGFRIPSILINIAQQKQFVSNYEVVTSSNMETAFLVGCIQWCFGGQKGDNIESFTYKMNKNIARWLLKEIQRRELTHQEQRELTPHVVTVIQNTLRQVPELELSLDLLMMVRMTEPVKFLMPFILSWSKSSNPMVVQRVRSFAEEVGVCIGNLISDLWSQSPPGSLDLGTYSFDPYSPGSRRSAGEHFSGSMPRAARSGRVNMITIHQRLLTILKKSPYGVLGARIPDIYQAEYGEPLQLHNRKLKDVLLGLDGVEMVGSDGPGDKLFRLVGNNGNHNPTFLYFEDQHFSL